MNFIDGEGTVIHGNMIGKTLLMYAAERGLMSVVEELLTHNDVDVTKRDNSGNIIKLIF